MKIAVIPARGGSKRIHGKNIREFHNKPIIAWSIAAAKSTGIFDKIIVSTDDEEIALIARNYGAETPFIRPNELADDFSGPNAVVKHTIQWFHEKGDIVEMACCIYATAPFVQPIYLTEGYKKLSASVKSFAFSVTTFPFPIQRAIQINQEGFIEPIWPENINARSQDLNEAYHDAAQFYWGTAKAFLNNVVMYSSESIPIILPRHLVQDIDTLEDWKRAEIMFEVLSAMGEINT